MCARVPRTPAWAAWMRWARRASRCCGGSRGRSNGIKEGPPQGAALEMVAVRTDSPLAYHRISHFLAATVLREGEAVLARNVMGDSALGSRDSKGEFHAPSVMCAPIRQRGRVVGLVHLYSTDSNRVPDPDDLEFTLAVADTLERVCVQTVESGFMTKDLASLVGPDQKWMNTQAFLGKLDEQLQSAMSKA